MSAVITSLDLALPSGALGVFEFCDLWTSQKVVFWISSRSFGQGE